MFDATRELAIQQLTALDGSVRLIVVHPSYVKQHCLLDTLLNEHAVVYVCFSGMHLSDDQLRQQLEQALLVQKGNGDLGGVVSLILDECDRAAPAAFDSFLAWAMTHVKRVVLIPRQVPNLLNDNATLRAITRFVPTEQSLMLWDYAQRPNPPALLEVRAFGTGRVMLNGKAVENWDGALPRSLFFYLVDQGMTTRNQIFETFWPRLTTREATNVFHVTKRKISEVLGTDLTTYWAGFYRISPDIELSYDASLFTQKVQDSAVMVQDEAITTLRQALTLYQGQFLNTIHLEWVKTRRTELLQMYGEALVTLGRIHEQRGEKDVALGVYLQASVTNRQREDLAVHIMKLYHEMGMSADALLAYDRLVEELDTHLKVKPGHAVQELAASIRRAKK